MSWWPQSAWFGEVLKRPSRRTRRAAPRPHGARPWLERLEARAVPARMVATGTGLDKGNEVRIWTDEDSDSQVSDLDPTSTEPLHGDAKNMYTAFNVEVHVAFADIDGDGNDELVVSPGASANNVGPGPLIRIYDITPEGRIGQKVDEFFAFTSSFQGGAWVAAGNIIPDARAADALVIGAGPGLGNGPRVRIYYDTDGDGRISDEVYVDQFDAYESGFKGGVRVAIGNINDQAGPANPLEIITAPGAGRAAEVRVFRDTDNDGDYSDNIPANEIAMPFPNYTGGLFIAAGDLNGDGRSELIVGPDQGNPATGAKLRIYSDTDGDGAAIDNLIESFTPITTPGYASGIRVAAGDLQPGGQDEIVIGAGKAAPGGPGARVKIYEDVDLDMAVNDGAGGNNPDDYRAYQNYDGGLFVAIGITLPGTVSATYAATDTPQLIPDTGAFNVPDGGTGQIVSSITVAPIAGLIVDLNIFIVIAHQANEDLDVSLTHTALDGTVTTFDLFSDLGNTNQASPLTSGSGMQLLLDDSAAAALGDGTIGSPLVGVFSPEGADLNDIFAGLDASGTWDLTVSDDTANQLSGYLLQWSLQFRFAI